MTPRKIPKEEIISQVESLYRFSSEQADNIRRQVTNILSKPKPPLPNITRQKRLALQNLNRDTDIIVLPVDKDNDHHSDIQLISFASTNTTTPHWKIRILTQ